MLQQAYNDQNKKLSQMQIDIDTLHKQKKSLEQRVIKLENNFSKLETHILMILTMNFRN